jgi:hypothetical protein
MPAHLHPLFRYLFLFTITVAFSLWGLRLRQSADQRAYSIENDQPFQVIVIGRAGFRAMDPPDFL